MTDQVITAYQVDRQLSQGLDWKASSRRSSYGASVAPQVISIGTQSYHLRSVRGSVI